MLRNSLTNEEYTYEQFKAGIAPYAKLGYKYRFRYHFSPIFLKFTNDVVGSIDGRTLLRRATIYLSKGANTSISIKDYGTDKERLKYTWAIPNQNYPPKIFKRLSYFVEKPKRISFV